MTRSLRGGRCSAVLRCWPRAEPNGRSPTASARTCSAPRNSPRASGAMRILAVNYEYTLTGSTLALLRLSEHLREAGHEVSVCAAVPAEGPMKEAYRERGFAVLDPPFPVGA